MRTAPTVPPEFTFHNSADLSTAHAPVSALQTHLKPIIMKFGGTSVGTLKRIRSVASRAMEAHANSKKPVVVVSAMAGETDRLLSLASDLAAEFGATRAQLNKAELDSLAATGEQISAALVALAIQSLGGKSRSFLAHQISVRTDKTYGDARISSIDPRPIEEALRNGEIPVVAGFQGIDSDGRVTTLGRGGSDTTAVAIAAALDATICEIYTDVEGVHTADPRVVRNTELLPFMDYETTQTLTSLGAKVLHPRSVKLAKAHGIPIQVRSSFSTSVGTNGGTFIGDENIYKGSFRDIHDFSRPIVAVTCEHHVNLIRLQPRNGGDPINFVTRNTEQRNLIDAFPRELWSVTFIEKLAAVSLVVEGEENLVVLVGQVLKSLAAKAISIHHLSANLGNVCCFVSASNAEVTIQSLHHEFVSKTLKTSTSSQGINHVKTDQN